MASIKDPVNPTSPTTPDGLGPGCQTRPSEIDEIEGDIHRTRAEMDRTFDALGRKLAPGQLLDDGWDTVREKTATGAGCPWNCPLHDSPRPAYREDECPRTLDLLTRAVLIDIADWWTERDCDSVATAIAKVLEAMGHISQP